MKTHTKVAIATLLILIFGAVFGAHAEPLPDFSHPKVQEDISWATDHARDPYLVLAHIRIEAGASALYIGGRRSRKDTATHTYSASHTGDYGRHQINCKNWRRFQRWNPVPKRIRIKRCKELYVDKKNRAIYYHLLTYHERTKSDGRIHYGVPRWIGHYQTGGAPPRKIYLKKLGWYYKFYKNWRKRDVPEFLRKKEL